MESTNNRTDTEKKNKKKLKFQKVKLVKNNVNFVIKYLNLKIITFFNLAFILSRILLFKVKIYRKQFKSLTLIFEVAKKQ